MFIFNWRKGLPSGSKYLIAIYLPKTATTVGVKSQVPRYCVLGRLGLPRLQVAQVEIRVLLQLDKSALARFRFPG